MVQGSRQVQTQAQQQVQTLSPQQILAVKLLELPTLELEERIHAELLDNPALEEGREESARKTIFRITNCRKTTDPKKTGRKTFLFQTTYLSTKH